MHFLSPIFLPFVALLTVPIIIHLIGRSRARVRRFPAMVFLAAAHRKVAQRTKLRQILLLIARASIMAAVPLILAKPFFEVKTTLPADVGATQSAVLVIDDSVSMRYQLGGKTLLQRAKAQAARVVSALPRTADVAVILGSRGAAPPVPELTSERSRVMRAISEIAPSYRSCDLAAAIKRAAQILSTSARTSGKRIYLISALPAHALDQSVSAPPGIEVSLVEVQEGRPLPNRAIVDVRADPALGLGQNGVRITAEVVNFDQQPVKNLPVTLVVDGKAVARGLLDLQKEGRAVKRFYHVLGHSQADEGRPAPKQGEPRRDPQPAEAALGLHNITVRLEQDDLPIDDERHLMVEVQRHLKVLLVDGDPRNLRRDDEVFYLETALRPGEREDSSIEVAIATLEDLSRRALSEYDAVFLCNVKAQELARTGRNRGVIEYIKGGGGLFISLGDNADAEAYNRVLGEILPQPLSGHKTAGPVRRPGEDGEPRSEQESMPTGAGERLGRMDRQHPLLLPFLSGRAIEGLAEARFGRYMLLQPILKETGEKSQEMSVLISYDTGAPALLERSVGRGRVLLFTSTIDRDWNDLPIQPAFLPLMQQSVRHLAGTPLRETDPSILVGQRREIKIQEGDTRVEVTFPSGQKRLFEWERLTGRRLLGFTQTDEPGHYRVAAASFDRVQRPRPSEFFVVNVDPQEADLRRASAERLAALSRRIEEGRPGEQPSQRRRVELWHALGALLILLLLGEAVLLREK